PTTRPTLVPYTTLFRSDSVVTGLGNVSKTVDKVVGFTNNIVDGWNKIRDVKLSQKLSVKMPSGIPNINKTINFGSPFSFLPKLKDRKSTRLNSSHVKIS